MSLYDRVLTEAKTGGSKVSASEKRKVNDKLRKLTNYYTKPGAGLSAVHEVLNSFGLELESSVTLGEREKKTKLYRLDIARSDPKDAFSPKLITNTLLVLSVYYKGEGAHAYEVTGHLS